MCSARALLNRRYPGSHHDDSLAATYVFSQGDFASWIKYSGGQDEHSVIADPLFADVSSGDFALRPGSPALALGFQPLPRTAATDCV